MDELETTYNEEIDLDITESGSDRTFDIYSPFRVDSANLAQDDLSWEQFAEEINRTSDSINNILFSEDTVVFLKDMADKFNLTTDQSAELSRIVRDILLKHITLEDMNPEINKRVTSDVAAVEQISNLIKTDLLKPVINILSPGGGSGNLPSLHEQNIGSVVDLRDNKK